VAVSVLYWHVKDKQLLLEAIIDRLFHDVEFAAPTGNRKIYFTARAERLYSILVETRDAAELAASALALGNSGAKLRETIAERSPEGVTTDAIMALIGHATLNQQRLQAQTIG